MACQLGTQKSLDGIVDYFIRIGLCIKFSQQFFGTVARDLKMMNLNINILTKGRIANLDIFLYCILLQKITKIVLTIVAE